MPPLIGPHQPLTQPVSAMRKNDLQALCRHFELNDIGPVTTLRQLLKTHLRNNRAQLENNPIYVRLYPRQGRGRQNPQPASEADPNDLQDHHNLPPSRSPSADNTWRGIHPPDIDDNNDIGAVDHLRRSSQHPPRPPVNITMLSSLINALNLSEPLDAAVAAAASVAFWGQCRLGEILSSSHKDTATSCWPSRQNLSMKSPHRQSSSYALFLPRTKTKRHGESITLVSQIGSSDPLHLLRNHLRVNDPDLIAPLFSYKTSHGPYTLTKHQFMIRCNNIWSKLGYPHTTGHSFRIGGTTELLLSGVPPDVVKIMGRWSSDSFLRYWRSLGDLAPRYAKNIRRSFQH